jgi:cytochrome c oxidase subunit 2
LDGTRSVGPSWKRLAASRVKLASGKTVTADHAYLTKQITDPAAATVHGYPGEVMAQAIGELGLDHRPADVRALVAFIDSLR